MPNKSATLDRRSLITGAAAASLAAVASQPETALGSEVATGSSAAGTQAAHGVSVARNGVYATVPLKQDSINIAAVQSQLWSIDLRDKLRVYRRLEVAEYLVWRREVTASQKIEAR